MTIGHGTWIAEAEIDRIADAGYSVCHNCSSNLRLSSGLAPVRALVDAGVNVALGIDEAGLNDDHDMLQEMRLAHHLSKAVDADHPFGLDMGRIFAYGYRGWCEECGLGASWAACRLATPPISWLSISTRPRSPAVPNNGRR